MADFTIALLDAELTNDPVSLSYSYSKVDDTRDAAIADIINNAAGDKDRTVNHVSVDAASMRAITTFDAYDGLSASETAWFTWLTGNGEIAVTTENLEDLAGIGGTSRWALADRTVMEPRMVALMQFTDGSRAQELWGEGFRVTPSQVAQARAV